MLGKRRGSRSRERRKIRVIEGNDGCCLYLSKKKNRKWRIEKPNNNE
jgi:hypothetical protein